MFTLVDVLTDGVCGMKVCCLRVIEKSSGNTKILKEMRPSFNNGRDYMFIDSVKHFFGVTPLGMKLVKLNKSLQVIDKSKKTWKSNWKLANLGKNETVTYAVMTEHKNIGTLNKHKNVLDNPIIAEENLRIRLFKGLFLSSDNIQRNILVKTNGSLIGIDENDIFGKRTIIWNKIEKKTRSDFDKNNYKTIVKDFQKVDKSVIKDLLLKYGFPYNCEKVL
jgi:hypothetical protein